jgi:hypothetical protein
VPLRVAEPRVEEEKGGLLAHDEGVEVHEAVRVGELEARYDVRRRRPLLGQRPRVLGAVVLPRLGARSKGDRRGERLNKNLK